MENHVLTQITFRTGRLAQGEAGHSQFQRRDACGKELRRRGLVPGDVYHFVRPIGQHSGHEEIHAQSRLARLGIGMHPLRRPQGPEVNLDCACVAGGSTIQGYERVCRGCDDRVVPRYQGVHGIEYTGVARVLRIKPALDRYSDVVDALLHRRPWEGVVGAKVAHDMRDTVSRPDAELIDQLVSASAGDGGPVDLLANQLRGWLARQQTNGARPIAAPGQSLGGRKVCPSLDGWLSAEPSGTPASFAADREDPTVSSVALCAAGVLPALTRKTGSWGTAGNRRSAR